MTVTMQQRINRRLAVMAALPANAPMPGAAARMAIFDSLPREVRLVIKNLDRCPSDMVQRAAIMHRARKPIKSIIKMLETKSCEAAGPIAREIAAQELQELGL